MEQRSSAAARAIAVAALICGFLVVLVIIVSALGGGSGDGGGHRAKGRQASQKSGAKQHKAPAVYVVENGDTLTAIAHETGVPVARIEELNPEVDPQILVSGEKLKLR